MFRPELKKTKDTKLKCHCRRCVSAPKCFSTDLRDSIELDTSPNEAFIIRRKAS
jgi:hypothetical protein